MNTSGCLLLSVNQQWELHGEPRDFYRFTPFGLRYQLEKAGFLVISIDPMGGLWSYIANRIGVVIYERCRRRWQRPFAALAIAALHIFVGTLMDRRHFRPRDTQTLFAIASRDQ